MSKKKKKDTDKEKVPWFRRRLPDPPPALVWGALLADLIALGFYFGKVVVGAAAWLVSPPGLAFLLIVQIALTIFFRAGK